MNTPIAYLRASSARTAWSAVTPVRCAFGESVFGIRLHVRNMNDDPLEQGASDRLPRSGLTGTSRTKSMDSVR